MRPKLIPLRDFKLPHMVSIHGANRPRAYLRSMIAELINKDRQGFSDLMARNKVDKLYAFGSSVHGPFTPTSDVDVYLDVNEPDDLRRGTVLMNLWDGLERFFGRRVDLLTDNSLRNPVLRNEVLRTMKLIYDGSRREVLV